MSETPNPEIPVDPLLIKRVGKETDRLFEGVFSEVSEVPAELAGGEIFRQAEREVYFPLGLKDDLFILETATPTYVTTEIRIRKQNMELSAGSYQVLESEKLFIYKDDETLSGEFDIDRDVYKDGKYVSGTDDVDEMAVIGFDPQIPEHLVRMRSKIDQMVEEREALRRMGPKFDNKKVIEIADILKNIDVSTRTVLRGTEEVDELDIRE